MAEYKTMYDLIIEAHVRAHRWRVFRHVVFTLCAVLGTLALTWIAIKK